MACASLSLDLGEDWWNGRESNPHCLRERDNLVLSARKGKSVGKAGVYDRQALVLVNRGTPEDSVTGGEVMTLARAIQTSVYERFGIRLEPEPVVV